MRLGPHVCTALGFWLIASPASSEGNEQRMPVAVELVLALDSSASVDKSEFDLELQGLAWALRQPEVMEVVDSLKPLGAAVAVVQWGGPGDTHVVVPFLHLESGRDAKAMGHLVSLIQRWNWASSTSIATAIQDSLVLLERNAFDGLRLVIDISGDGADNGTADLQAARDLARRRQVTLNGLPIEADDSTLTNYYRDNVIAGPGAFVETARDFEDFARAVKEKLVRELRPLGS
jgi:hypothetical protein